MATGATLIIKPQAAASAESQPVMLLDDTLNLDAAGKAKTRFYPGDRVYLLLQIPDGVEVTAVRSSDGTLARLGTVTRQKTEIITATEEDVPVSLSAIPSGGVTAVKWYGNHGSIAGIDGRKITISGDMPIKVMIRYSFEAVSYMLDGVDEALEAGEEWPVEVRAYMEDADADNCPA